MTMRNGNQYRCDNPKCERTEFVTREDLGFNEGPRGWIMMTMNEPRDYGWSFREAKHSPMVMSPADFCSIDCARQILQACFNDTLTGASDVPIG